MHRGVLVAVTTSEDARGLESCVVDRLGPREAIRGWWSTVVRAKTRVLAAVVCRSDDEAGGD